MKWLLLKIALFFLVFLLPLFALHAQTFKWVKGGGTNYTTSAGPHMHEASYYICTDPNGNVYSLNQVAYGAITADTFYRSGSYGAVQNILLTSYNCSGQMRWVKLIASSAGACSPLSIAADNLGHIYVSGILKNGTLHIGDDTTISGLVYNHLGLVQFDTNGHFNWVRYVGNNTAASYSATYAFSAPLLIDSSNNVHLLPYLNFGAVLRAGDTSHYGVYDLTYSTSGTLSYIRRLQLDSTLFLEGTSIDRNSGKIYGHGFRNSSISSGSPHNFIAAFDTGRNLIWTDTLYASSTSSGFSDIKADGNGHIYFLGGGSGLAAYRGDTIAGAYYSFVVKADTAGNPQWMRRYTATMLSGFNSLTLTSNNKLAATGAILGQLSSAWDTITSYAGETNNPCLTVLDTSGNVTALKQIHANATYDWGLCLTSDRMGNLYIGGQVGDSIWADSAGYRSVGGYSDFFVMKYGVDCSCTSMPIATSTLSSSGAGGSVVSFTYTGATSGIDSMRWFLGDGTTTTTTSPTHTYSAIGTYHACVRIYSFCGDDVHCRDITIPCLAAPTSSLSSSGTPPARSFTYTGTTTALDSVVWTFGDGGHATGVTASHTYAAIGTYTACVTAYNPCGSDSSCGTVTIPCITMPVANYSYTGSAATRNFTYTGATTALDSVSWRFGDGARATGSTASHTYASPGTFTACVIAYTPCGIDTQCYSITIPCAIAPVASFTHGGVTSISFSYIGTSVALDSIVWTFGDGGHATGTTTSHTYAAVGTYTACVTAYNPCGSDSACVTITIPCIAGPTANFTNTPIASGSYTDTFTYTGTTTGLDSVAWYFGDSGHSAGTIAYHTYALPDTYTVCVFAYNPCGWDSTCYTVIVPCDTPVADFTTTGMIPVNFTYTGTPVHLDSVVWWFGGGGYATGTTAAYSYPITGTYLACVIAYGLCANDTSCHTVTATGTAVASVSLHSVVVFPNPATDDLFITEVLEQMNYRLLNVAGVSLQQGALQRGSNMFSLKEYAPGIYILEITSRDGQRNMVKVVKE